MVDQVQKGHGWLAHTLQRLHLLTWVQKNAPRLKAAAKSLGKPALSVGTNLASAVFSTILALSTIAFLSLFMLLEAPQLRAAFLGAISPGLRRIIEEVSATVSRSVTSYVLGTVALSLPVRGGHLRHHARSSGCPSPSSSACGWRWWP